MNLHKRINKFCLWPMQKDVHFAFRATTIAYELKVYILYTQEAIKVTLQNNDFEAEEKTVQNKLTNQKLETQVLYNIIINHLDFVC